MAGEIVALVAGACWRAGLADVQGINLAGGHGGMAGLPAVGGSHGVFCIGDDRGEGAASG